MNNFDSQMIRDRLTKNHFENPVSYWLENEHNGVFDEDTYPSYAVNEIRTRVVWITNYTTDEHFPIYVSATDPLHHIANLASSSTELEPVISKEKDLFADIHSHDLSKLNLDDLLLLLHRLQQQTSTNPVIPSASAISFSSSSSSSEPQPSFRFSSPMPTLHSFSPTLSKTVHSSLSLLDEIPTYSHAIDRRQSTLNLSNIADVPKQLTTTLAKPVTSFHSQSSQHIHSPNDVVNKLLQSFNPSKPIKPNPKRHPSNYTYQQSQQHKAQLISNLLPRNIQQNNFYR